MFDQWLLAGGPRIYAGILILAVLEGFILTTFLTNGTIGFIALGALLFRGYLNPWATIGCIYIGTVVGDALTFALSARLLRIAVVAQYRKRCEKYTAPLAASPFRFVVLGHLTPYVKGASALLAGGVVPGRKWIQAEAVGALGGTLLFTGIGAAGAAALLNARQSGIVSAAVGVGLVAVLVAVWIRCLRPCSLTGLCAIKPRVRTTSRAWKQLWFLVYFPIWHPIRWIEAGLRKLPSRSKHPDLAAAFPDARAGDIFLVRLHAPAPWGKWAHAAIATDPDQFCHGFDKTITSHRFDTFPVRYTVAHLRVKCDSATATRAGAAAAEMLGRRVSIFAHPDDVSKFSCTSLVCYAFKVAGVPLRADGAGRVTPDDLMYHPLTEVLRIVRTENALQIAVAREEASDAARQPLS